MEEPVSAFAAYKVDKLKKKGVSGAKLKKTAHKKKMAGLQKKPRAFKQHGFDKSLQDNSVSSFRKPKNIVKRKHNNARENGNKLIPPANHLASTQDSDDLVVEDGLNPVPTNRNSKKVKKEKRLKSKDMNGDENEEKTYDCTDSVPMKRKKVSKKKQNTSNGDYDEYEGSETEQVQDKCGDPSSIEEGFFTLAFLIGPNEPETFFKQFWEKVPFAIQRDNPNYFKNLISLDGIDEALRTQHVEFTTNIDITAYKNGERSTLNPDGRALPRVVWDSYSDGCSVRLLNPQKFFPPIRQMISKLQEFFHCMVGANVYLTPPNSQGFAPHYDDIEAFVLQVEGQKMWKLYKPISESEVLPRYSSKNFSQDEIDKPIMEVLLKAGDMLYFPRGIIHQAETVGDQHSLHITLSCYQKHSFADLFEILVPKMLSKAIEEEVSLRQGLPMNIWKHFGVVHQGDNSAARSNIQDVLNNLFEKVFNQDLVDEAVDEMAKRFQHDAIPPVLTTEEKQLTAFGCKTKANENGFIQEMPMIHLNSRVRLLRANILRLVFEEDKYLVYYYLDNSIDYHEYEANYLEVDEGGRDIVEVLIKEYPEYTEVKNLPGDEEQQVSIVQEFWDRGLLIVSDVTDFYP